jgi:hypothetical protein
MTQPMATFVVEYPCDRRCQVELDLSEIHARFTHGQMLRVAEGVHLEAHEAAAVRVFSPRPEAVVRAGVLSSVGVTA